MIKRIWLMHPSTEMCDAFKLQFAELPKAHVVQSTFEELDSHDCFVTAGNSFGIMTAGIDAAVVGFFGPQLMHQIQHRIMDQYLGEQPVGTAFIHPTSHLHIPFVAHAPTMRVPGSIDGTDKVYCATWAALLAIHAHNIVDEQKIETVAFPAMGTGFGGVPFVEAARQMAAAYKHYLSPPHRLDWTSLSIGTNRSLIMAIVRLSDERLRFDMSREDLIMNHVVCWVIPSSITEPTYPAAIQ